jgi:hypothetical protein
MRDVNFREWLGRRRWKGAPLKAGMIDGRIRRLKRIERALEELGFEERDLDALHAAGRWPELMERLRLLFGDWRSNAPAARRMAPQSPDPTRQLMNIHAAARQYGHFAEGRDPNYDAEQDLADAGDEIDEQALDHLRAKFLETFPDFESGGGFPGRSSYHPEEDEYKRPLIAAVQARLAERPVPDEAELGGWLLDQLLPDKSVNLIGDYRRKQHLRTVRDRSGGAFERAVGRLTLSDGDLTEAAEAFTREIWPLILKGSEQSKPYGDSRILATLFPALARPGEAISIATRKFENLAQALIGRKLFGWNPITAAEYRDALALSRRLFQELEEWGWRPRDLWDVQGFIWVTCEEKPVADPEQRDAERVRRYALENYIVPARERGDPSVAIRAGDVHNALGMSAAHANVCQALRGRKFLKMAALEAPSVEGPDNSSTTTFTYAIGSAPPETEASGEGPFWFVGASFGRTHDQVERFLRGGFWEISEPTARQRDQVLSMKPGQRIAIKATFVKRLNLPFDNRGRSVSVMPIKAIGTITANPGDGERVSVTWERDYSPREWYHYTYQPTIWEVYPDKEMARRLIAFAFEGAEQDYDWFLANLSNWKDLALTAEAAEEESRPDPRPRDPQNIILFGPPGTGKTHRTMAEAVRLCLGLDADDPLIAAEDRRSELRAEYERLRALGQIAFVTFHQSYAYEDFIEGREPRPIAGSAGFELATRPGLFVRFARKAVESEEEHVLIIDEINRANVSKVFGELITLIEPDKRKGMQHSIALRLPYSQDEFSVPANLHIVATMNTADRSIALLDTALRRRFVFREIAPKAELLAEDVDGVPLRRLLEVMNERVEYLIDRDHRIGHAFFMGEGGKNRAAIDATMRDKIIPLLQEFFFEDWSRVASVLGGREGAAGGFLDRALLKDPTGEGEDRPSWSVRTNFAEDAYLRLVGGRVVSDDAEPTESP